MKRLNKKGFTLAELLIVVAIIAILIAIAIPVFTSSLEKAREATDAANIRAAYAEMMVELIDNGTVTHKEVALQQTDEKWTDKGPGDAEVGGVTIKSVVDKPKGTWDLTIDADGKLAKYSSGS